MDRRRIGGDKSIEFAERIFDLSSIETGEENTLVLVYFHNLSKIAVEHLFVIVVLGLHDFVSRQEDGAKALDP